MSASSLHECLHRFPGAVLELSAAGVVVGSNGHLDEAVGRDLAGRPLAEVLDGTSRHKWGRILAVAEDNDPDVPWELVFHTPGSMELRTFLVVWGDPGEDRRFWLLEHAPSRRAERMYDEISALNSELVHAHREVAREQRRLAGALGDATAAISARDEVLAFVSHDLRNPLQMILMASEVLDLPIPDDRKAVQVQAIRRAAMRMSRLIEDLLTVSEVEAGRLALEREPLLLDAVFEAVCSQFESLAVQKRQRLHWKVAPDVPPVEGDPHRLVQSLSNLVGNALKFTPEDGLVVVLAVRDGGEVVVSVEDTGIGIPEAEIPHVFTRFWHAGRANRGGSGARAGDLQGNRGGARGAELGGEPGGGGNRLLLHAPDRERVEGGLAARGGVVRSRPGTRRPYRSPGGSSRRGPETDVSCCRGPKVFQDRNLGRCSVPRAGQHTT